jgi:hypothetical protein
VSLSPPLGIVSIPGRATEYPFKDGKPLAQYDVYGNCITEYIYMGGRLITLLSGWGTNTDELKKK